MEVFPFFGNLISRELCRYYRQRSREHKIQRTEPALQMDFTCALYVLRLQPIPHLAQQSLSGFPRFPRPHQNHHQKMNGVAGGGGPLPVPVFRPSLEEMTDFSSFVDSIEGDCAVGAALIHPPAGWRPRANISYNDLDDMQITKPIQQEILGCRGVYLTVYVERPRRTVAEFRKEAEEFGKRSNAPIFPAEPDRDLLSPEKVDEIDRAFWRSLLFRRPTYGADFRASLFSDECEHFNFNKLDTILNVIDQITGVHTPYLYFGMWGAMFAFHCEDADLYSLNYLHTGAPKVWYSIPPAHRKRFEELNKRSYPNHFRNCDEFMRHKQALLSTDLLRRNGIPYGRVVQTPGTFMVVFPGSYHAGYSLGFNIGEAVNFASPSWIPMGLRAKRCLCLHDTVNLNVQGIVRALFPGSAAKQFEDQVPRKVAEPTKRNTIAGSVRTAKRRKRHIPPQTHLSPANAKCMSKKGGCIGKRKKVCERTN